MMRFLLSFKMIFHILRNKYLIIKDFCIAYHILLSTVGKYYLTHIAGHTEGDIFYFYIIRKVKCLIVLLLMFVTLKSMQK